MEKQALRKKGAPRAVSSHSFAYGAKNEICAQMPEGDEARAELAAMTLAISDVSRDDGLRYTTENLAVARRIVRLMRDGLGFAAKVAISSNIRRSNTYTVRAEDARSLLASLGLESTRGALPRQHTKSRKRRIACVRGAFLAGGSISNPRKNYHAELVVGSSPFATSLREMLLEFGIDANIFTRNDRFVLYLNEGDSIVALLALTGAHSSIFQLENVRILKETRNNVNRAVNCETANINKTVDAALNQIHSIHIIEGRLGLGALSASLRETAQLRLDHPEATLQELCELSGTSKSCMNHRLRKINSIARALSEEDIAK